MGLDGQPPIYLEPRRVFDAALLTLRDIVYSVERLLDIIQSEYELDNFDDVLEYFLFNVEPLVHYGLRLEYDSEEISE
jgi:hypothetical protein